MNDQSGSNTIFFIIQDSEFKIKTTGEIPVFGLFVPLPLGNWYVLKYLIVQLFSRKQENNVIPAHS